MLNFAVKHVTRSIAGYIDIKGKSYIGTPQKYYFMDMGLRNARIHFRQMEVTHSMENVIYNELRMRGFSVDVGNLTIVEKGKKDRAGNQTIY